jgi:predicted house-cleaning NTP pyrophosphatase (Maf/HAM1 superfamily)
MADQDVNVRDVQVLEDLTRLVEGLDRDATGIMQAFGEAERALLSRVAQKKAEAAAEIPRWEQARIDWEEKSKEVDADGHVSINQEALRKAEEALSARMLCEELEKGAAFHLQTLQDRARMSPLAGLHEKCVNTVHFVSQLSDRIKAYNAAGMALPFS